MKAEHGSAFISLLVFTGLLHFERVYSMKNIPIRIALFMIALVLILPLIAACNQQNTGSDTTAAGSNTTDAAGTTDENTVKPPPTHNVNYGGEEFVIIGRGSQFGDWECKTIEADEINSDVISMAVFKRNQIVQSKYNVKIKGLYATANMLVEVKLAINSGHEFDAIIAKGTDAANLAQQGFLANLYSLDYLNLTQPYWDQKSVEKYTVDKKLFYVVSDIDISDDFATWAVCFNKTLLNDLKLENPYDLVKNDQWYYEKYYEMAKAASFDYNNDGMDTNDRYGIISEPYDSFAMFFASGEQITKNDENGLPQLVAYNTRSVNVMEKIAALVSDRQNYTTFVGPANFAKGQCLFTPTTFASMYLYFLSMEDDYGIVPPPKMMEGQDRYYTITAMHGSGGVVCVPNNADMEKAGILLEELGYQSYLYLRPAFYEKVYEGRVLRDEDSIEMLALIIDSKTYDAIVYYDMDTWYMNYFFKLSRENVIPFTSFYRSVESATKSKIEAMIEAYRNLD